MANYQKLGYLREDFRVFHLTDENAFDVDFHYHDFHKIIVILKGNLSYNVEGRTYALRSNDIIFVAAGEVHRPIFHDKTPYERIIIYISKEYLATYETEELNLGLCFMPHSKNHSHVLRIPGLPTSKLGQVLRELEASFDSDEYASKLYHNLKFLEFLILLNRVITKEQGAYISNTSNNQKMPEVIDYINAHLTEDLTIDKLAETFYLSRYYFMHTFKEETGYSIGNYISTKRLHYAKELIMEGTPVTKACFECGFRNYSTFLRAYQKQFQVSPTSDLNVPTRYSLEVE